MKNLTVENIAKAVNGKVFNYKSEKTIEASGVVIDSRKVEKDFVFFAFKGERSDGHQYLEDVIKKGALITVVEDAPSNTDIPYILVDSTFLALKELAEFYRENLTLKIVAITGSVGKTSTKEFIASVLSEKYRVLKTEGNFNNEIGLPLTIFNIRDEHEVAVLEHGISDFNEMHRLSKISKPDICVLTNIGYCHLENLKNRDGVLKAKTELFDFAKDDFKIVINGDDDKLNTISDNGNLYRYGMNEEFFVYAKNIKEKGLEGINADIYIEGKCENIDINVPGIHMVYNAMAAAAVGKILGMSEESIKNGINNLKDIGGRLNIIKTDKIRIIDDCYNANPVSVKSSLNVLLKTEGEKVAILGDMFELGEDEVLYHREIGEYCKTLDSRFVFVGGLSYNTYLAAGGKENKDMYYFKTVEEFLYNKENIIKNGDTVLVKASHSMHFDKIVEGIR